MSEKKTEWEDIVWPDLDRELTLREKLFMARPGEQIELLRPLVEKYNLERAECSTWIAQAINEGLEAKAKEKSFGEAEERLAEKLQSWIDRWTREIEAAELEKKAETAELGLAGYKGSQQKKAKLPRSPIIPLVKRLLKEQPADAKAKELWPHLFSLLEEAELDPEETSDDNGPVYLYYPKGKEKSLKLKRFETIVSKLRNK